MTPCSRQWRAGLQRQPLQADHSSASASRCSMRRSSADRCGLSGESDGPVPRHHGPGGRETAFDTCSTPPPTRRAPTPLAAPGQEQVSEPSRWKRLQQLQIALGGESERPAGAVAVTWAAAEEVLVEGGTPRIPPADEAGPAPTGSLLPGNSKTGGEKDYQAGDRGDWSRIDVSVRAFSAQRLAVRQSPAPGRTPIADRFGADPAFPALIAPLPPCHCLVFGNGVFR